MRSSVCLLILLLVSVSEAKTYLLWEFPRAYTPIPAFLVTLDSHAGTQQLLLPTSKPGTCLGIDDATTETYCAELACPGAGIFTVTLYAWWEGDGMKSDGSNAVSFQIIAG